MNSEEAGSEEFDLSKKSNRSQNKRNPARNVLVEMELDKKKSSWEKELNKSEENRKSKDDSEKLVRENDKKNLVPFYEPNTVY